MKSNSGLTAKDAQYAICKGTYGGKEWSAEDRQTACQQYEELGGGKLETSNGTSSMLLATTVLVALIVITLACVFYKRKFRNNTSKNKHR